MHEEKSFSIVTCGCWFLVALFNVLVGAWSVNYILLYFLGKMIPLWGAMLIGLFTAEISVPVAVVIALLRFFHIM